MLLVVADFNLNEFLAQQQSQGTAQGEGGFTVSHSKAAQKMVQHSLPREFAWVLKIVQAAVGWACPVVTITQTRNSTTFIFTLPDPLVLPDNQELVKSILRFDTESDRPCDCLGAGLRILVERGHQSFMVRLGEAPAIYAGVYFGEMGESARARHRERWTEALCLKINHIPHTHQNRLLLNYVPIKDYGLPLLMELERYAYVSPMQIYVDGRRIDGVLHSGALKWNIRKRPIRLSGLAVPGKDSPSLNVCEGFANQAVTLDTPREEIVRNSRQHGLSQAYFVLSFEAGRTIEETSARKRRCSLHWVRLGVVVESEPFPLQTRSLGLDIYASAEGLDSDLSGFQLQRNEAYLHRRLKVLQRMVQVLEFELSAERTILNPPDESIPAMEQEKAKRKAIHGFIQALKIIHAEFTNNTAWWDLYQAGILYRTELLELHAELKKVVEPAQEAPVKNQTPPQPQTPFQPKKRTWKLGAHTPRPTSQDRTEWTEPPEVY